MRCFGIQKCILEKYLSDVSKGISRYVIYRTRSKINKERLANAEPFLFSENGEVVFWDSRNRDDKGECPIYLVDFSTGIYLAGNTFKEFILNLTNETKVKTILKFAEHPLLKTFEPLSLETY